MNFDDNITEVFDRYLTGQMTEVEEREFLNELEKDPSLKQNYETHRALVAGIREARKEELKDYIKQNAKIRYIGNIWSTKWIVTSAAVVSLVLSAYILIEFALKPNQNSKEVAEATEQTKSESNAEIEVAEDASEPSVKSEESDDTSTEPNLDVIESIDGYNGLTPEELKNSTAMIKKSVPVISNSDLINSEKASSKANTNATIDVYYENGKSTQYRYKNNKLILYRFPYQDDVVIYQTGEGTDYLAWKGLYYSLVKDDKVHSLQEVKDEKIIKTLRSL